MDGRYYPSAGANSYVDTDTSKILVFGNVQHVSPDIHEQNGHMILRVSGYRFEVTDWYPDEGFSAEAIANIEKSINRYNADCHANDSPWGGF